MAAEGEEEWDEEMFWQETDDFLLKLQLRIIYRLGQLKPMSYSTSDIPNIEATGTLYILLQKIRNFYNNQNRENPLQSKVYRCKGTALNNWLSAGHAEESISSMFYEQVKFFSNANISPDSEIYQKFLTLLDYAVAFEVTRNFMGNIEEYVKRLDEHLNRNKYEQNLSPAVEFLFLTWYENVRYNNNHKKLFGVEQQLNAFQQFIAADKYAVPTRIYALEVLGAMFRAQGQAPVRQEINQADAFLKQGMGFIQKFYNYELSEQHRQLFSSHVASLYCPLISTNRYSMEDYGLDSKQMKMLANKLAWIYNDFYDITTPEISMPGTSKPRGPVGKFAPSCFITTNTPVNTLKQKQEMDEKILTFAAESIFWVFGGEIFSFLGRGFRITRGAMMSLPRALKASAVARKGKKLTALSVEITKGIRMSNLPKNLARNGVRVTAVRKVAEKTKRGLGNAAAGGAGSGSAVETVDLTHNLGNQYSPLNPRRWFGQKPGEVLEYQVTQQKLGFGLNIGKVNGNLLRNGINSYQDWRRFSRNIFKIDIAHPYRRPYLPSDPTLDIIQFRLADPLRRMSLYTYSWADQKLLQSEAAILQFLNKMGQKGLFDIWLPPQGIALPNNGGILLSAQKGYEFVPVYKMEMSGNIPFFQRDFVIRERNLLNLHKRLSDLLSNGEFYSYAAYSPITPAATDLHLTLRVRPENAFRGLTTPEMEAVGMRVSWDEIRTGTWKHEVAKQLYVPMDWGNSVTNFFMPRYIPKKYMTLGVPGAAQTLNTSPFVRGLTNTIKLFLGMEVADLAMYPFFQNWMTSTAEQEQNQLLQKYPKLPQLEAENEQAAQETRKLLENAGFNTASVNPIYNEVIGAARQDYEGSSISFPFVATWHYTSKLPGIPWNSPFQQEGNRMMLDMQYRRLQRNSLIQHYQHAKDERSLNASIQNVLEGIRIAKSTIPDLFAQLRQSFPGDWSAEEQAMASYYQEYAAEIQEAAQISNIREKNTQLEKIVNKYNNQAENWDKRLDNKARSIAAPEGENAFFRSLIEQLETHRNEFRLRMFNPVWTATYPDMAESFSTEYAQLLSNTIAQIKGIKKQHISFMNKYSKMGQIFNSLDQQSLQLAKKYKVNQFEQHNSSAPAAAYDDMIPQN